MADLLAQTYNTAKSIIDQWNNQAVSTVIPNDSTVIADGAATDGRPQVTDAQVTTIITRCIELVSWMEQDSLNGTGTNNKAILGTVLAVAVNGGAHF